MSVSRKIQMEFMQFGGAFSLMRGINLSTISLIEMFWKEHNFVRESSYSVIRFHAIMARI